MSDSAIKVENISKLYHIGAKSSGSLREAVSNSVSNLFGGKKQENPETEFWALRDISFEVKKGDVVGVIGKNGAGKSTLLKLLSRITQPTTGKISINGRVGSLLEVGTGFQPELTGRENIFLNGSILGMTRREIQSKFDEIVDFSGIEKFIDTPVKRYSSGMYVRLAFSVAAHLEPEVLIIDEVLAVGDAEFQKKCIGKMKDVAGHGRTIIFVSHNISAVKTLCESGLLLRNGKLEFAGKVEDAVDRYIEASRSKTVRSVNFQPDQQKQISINKVQVTATGKNPSDLFEVKDKLKLEIEYTVNGDTKGTNISFALNNEGITLFRSWDVDTEPELLNYRKSGTYKTEFMLPDILQKGTYSVYVAAGRPGVGAIDVREDCLTFEIDNNLIDGTKSSFTRGGLIRPEIVWKTSPV